MTFRFSLDSVLKFRKLLENRELQALENLQRDAAQLKNRLSELESLRMRALEVQKGELQDGTSAGEVQSLYNQQFSIAQSAQRVRAQLDQNKHLQQTQIERYRKARADRELLESMRERALQSFNLDFTRREQRSIDDLFGSRKNRKD